MDIWQNPMLNFIKLYFLSKKSFYLNYTSSSFKSYYKI